MTARPVAIAVLLTVSVALAADPSLAAFYTAGYEGDAAETGTEDAVIPEGGTLPLAPPTRDGTAPMPGREALYHAYATVSRSADGTTTVTPASPRLRAVIDEEYGFAQ